VRNKTEALEELTRSAVSRRDFAKRTWLGSLVAVGGLSVIDAQDLLAQQITDVDILNFALQLEYLEAEFYTVATTGRRIQDAGIAVNGRGRGGATTGGAQVSLDERTRVVADAITRDEQAHVRFLRTALGGDAVAKPEINLEALNLGFRNQNEFITLARAFEDVGVSAYGGAAPLIDNARILAAAARIALTEAQHGGVLRYLAYQGNVTTPPVDEQDVPAQGSPNGQVFFVDGNGLSIVRQPDKVAAIVYGGRGRAEGGFFPAGLNGLIERS
jgi:hypothetical protein